MKKYLTKLFTKIFFDISIKQLDYQKFISLENAYELQLSSLENEISYITSKIHNLNKKIKIFEEKQSISIDEQKEYDFYKLEIIKLKNNLDYLLYTDKNTKIKLDNIIYNRKEFENENKEYFNTIK